MIWVGNSVLPEGDQPDHINRLSSYTGAMAQSNPTQPNIGPGDKKTGVVFGKRVAETLVRWMAGGR